MSLLSPALEAFVAVVRYKTVHGAANAIHLTQTAVTQRIRNLEERLSTSLFTRSRRGMLLTPEGEALLRYCNAAKDLEGETLAQIKGAALEAEVYLRITGPTSIMRARIIPHCFNIIKKFPKLLMQFDVNDVEEGLRSLRNGESQFAITTPENILPEMQAKILEPEKYVLVCTHKWKQRKLLDILQSERIIDYDPKDQLTFNYLKHFHLFKYARHERHFVNRTDALALLLMQGLGYGLLTTEFSKPYIDDKRLTVLNEGKTYENRIALAWYLRPAPPRYFSAVIAAIR